MKKNVGIIDRIIRFTAVDLLLGFSFLGFDIPLFYANLAFILAIIIAIPMIFGYSFLYQILGRSSREKGLKKPAEVNIQ